MATQKPISTISYNTEGFLREKLDGWLQAHIIQAYQYICHKGEDGDKDHIHVRIEPNKRLDPMDLQDELKEYQIGHDKPLGCRPFRPSKEEDWFLYAVHDKKYLRLKYGGGERGEKLPYSWKDIRVPDNYDCEVAFVRAMAHMEHTTANMAERLRGGEDPFSLVLEGENVYVINALMHAIQKTDYQRVCNEILELKRYLFFITEAIKDYGLSIEEDDSGKIKLKKVD